MQALFPLILFVILFLGSGIVFSLLVPGEGFYEVSPVLLLVPSILYALFYPWKHWRAHGKIFLSGACEKSIRQMVIVFVLAGLFANLTQHIGATSTLMSMGMALLPASWYLPGLFLISSILALLLGTSMGVIVTMGPVAAALALEAGVDGAWCLGAVISGAMFGDNLSFISDTTLAALKTQGATLRAKLRINSIIAVPAVAITLVLFLLPGHPPGQKIGISLTKPAYVTLLPYAAIIFMGIGGIEIFKALLAAIGVTCAVGLYTSRLAATDILPLLYQTFGDIYTVSILSVLIAGLSQVMTLRGGVVFAQEKIMAFVTRVKLFSASAQRSGKVAIALLGALADTCTANNTVAIIIVGKLIREIRQRFHVHAAAAAALVDIFTCGMQGMLPYSAQVLLASTYGRANPVHVALKSVYCPVLMVVATGWILFSTRHSENKPSS